MKMPRVIAQFFIRAVLSLALISSTVMWPSQTARADIDETFSDIKACFNTVYTPKLSIAMAAKLADAKFLQCSSQISGGDVVMIGIASVLSILAASGQITSEDDCNAKINAVIGVLIAKVLLESDAIKSVLGSNTVEMLKTYVSGNGAALLSEIPALSAVFNQLSCGCSVAGTTAEIKQLLIEMYGDAKQCKGFVEDIAGAFIDTLESGIDAAGNVLEDTVCVLSGGLISCPDDSATNESDPKPTLTAPPKCISEMTPKKAYVHGNCECLPPKGKTLSSDKKSISCKICPDGQGRNGKGFCEACPPGVKADNTYGGYGVCSKKFTCPAGAHINATNMGCEKDCGAGQVLEGGSCKTCPPNTATDYPSSASSIGTCRACGDDYWSDGGSDACYSKCAGKAQKWDGKECVNACAPGTRINNKDVGDLCVACEEGTESNAAATACLACPVGTNWKALATGGGRCGCPEGSTKSNGQCTPCPKDWDWSSDDKGDYCKPKPGSGFPPPGCGKGQKLGPDGYKCIAICGFRAVNDKADPKKCIQCKEGEVAYAGTCVGASLTTMPNNTKGAPPLNPIIPMCPEGSQLNASSNACIKRVGVLVDKCGALGPNYVKSERSTNGCEKCPMGKVANASGTLCINARTLKVPQTEKAPGIPPIDVPETRAPPPPTINRGGAN